MKFWKHLVLFCALSVFAFGQARHEVTAESNQTITGKKVFTQGIQVGPVAVTSLSSSAGDGTIIGTTDGTPGSVPCTGGGDGALAFKISGVWACLPKLGGTSGATTLSVNGNPISNANLNDLLPAAGSGLANCRIQTSGSDVSIGCPVGQGQGQGTGDISSTPLVSQEIVQPVGTEFRVNNLAGTRIVGPAYAWSQTISQPLTAGFQATVTLTPCPVGIDVSNNVNYGSYGIKISGIGTTEAAQVTGGSCTSGGTSGTIIFTPAYDHATGWTASSATDGIQEALNDAGTPNWHVIVPPKQGFLAGYEVYWPIIVHNNKGWLDGQGATLNCHTRSRCIQTGDLVNSNDYGAITVSGFRLSPRFSDPGCFVTSTRQTAGVRTVAYTGSCSYKVGDFIRIDFTDNPYYWGDHVLSAASAGSVSWVQGSGDIAQQDSAGTIAAAHTAVLDNAMGTHFEHLRYQYVTDATNCSANPLNRCFFNSFFDFWDDEAAVVTGFNNDGVNVACSATYCGSFFYSGGLVGGSYGTGGVTAPVISIDHSTITANCGMGITSYNSNAIQVSDSILQATSLWDYYVSNIKGNYQGASVSNVYNETSGCIDTPFGRTGMPSGHAGMMIGPSTGAAIFKIDKLGGLVPQIGSGSTASHYWVIAKDTTAGTQTVPMRAVTILNNQTGTVTPYWPRVASSDHVITYDLLRTTGSLGTNLSGPGAAPVAGAGNCPGGSVTACGSVATNIPQSSCSINGGLVCSVSDDVSLATTPYTVPSLGTFAPALNYWPGALTVSSVGGEHINLEVPPQAITATRGWANGPVVYSNSPDTGTENTWIGNLNDDGRSAFGFSVGSVLTNQVSGASPRSTKGRLNFKSDSIPAGGMSIITLVDSNPASTMATPYHRPNMDAGDTYLGIDNPVANSNLGQARLAIGGGGGIYNYVGSKPDGTSYLESLTASKKTFVVPVTAMSALTALQGCNGCSPFNLVGIQNTDSFNRADGGLGANWSNLVGTLKIVSNKALWDTKASFSGGYASAASYTGSYSGEQYAQAKIFYSILAAGFGGIFVRGSGNTFYWFGTTTAASYLYKAVNGINSLLATGPVVPSGDTIRLEVRGTNITAYDEGIVTLTATDIAIGVGNPGIVAMNPDATYPFTFDDFKGGDLAWSGTVLNETFSSQLFSALASCSSSLDGQMANVRDSTTNSLGATISGGGSYHVLAYCNGTSWTAAASLGGGSGMVWPAAGIPISNGSGWSGTKTVPAGNLVGDTDTQTLTNKTVNGVSPAIMAYLDATSSVQTQLNGKVGTGTTVNGHALSSNVTVTASDVGLGNVTNIAQAPLSIYSNNPPASGQIPIGNAVGAYIPQPLSLDANINSSGSVTVRGLGGYVLPTLTGSGYLNWTGSGWSLSTTAGMVWPGGTSGIPLYTGSSAWTDSQIPFNVGTSTMTGNITGNAGGTAAGLSAQYINWSASSGGTSIANKPTIPTDVSGKKYIIQTADAALPSAQALGTLGTGILKNTTTTGVLSIAVAGDFPTLNQSTSGTASNLSGTPTLPNGTAGATQTSTDNSTKLATDAFVKSQASNTTPLMNGAGSAGTADGFARPDHVHPSDTTRAADNAVVHNSGDETIAGSKTFSSPISIAGPYRVTSPYAGSSTITTAGSGNTLFGVDSDGKFVRSYGTGTKSEFCTADGVGCPAAAGGVYVNGNALTGPNFNATTPAAQANNLNVTWQYSGTSVSAQVAKMGGDAGSGGTLGLVPAPASGDAAAGKYLKADGTWAVPPGGGANPGGTGSEIQYRAGGSSFGAVSGSSVSGANVTLTGTFAATAVSATTAGTGYLKVAEGASPTAAGSGYANIYVDASHNLACEYGASKTACIFPSGSMVYPGTGLAISTGAGWGTSITETDGQVLYGSGGAWTKSSAPAISAANMTSFPTLNQNTTGTAAGLTAAYIDWNSGSGGNSIQNKPSTFTPTAHNLLSSAHGDTTAGSAVRGDMIAAVGASPTWQKVAHSSATGGYWKWNGTDVVASTGAASGTGSPTACTNQVVTGFTLNADAAPTSSCTTITSAYTSGTFSPSSHDIISGHSASSLTTGQVIRATGATTFAFGALDLANSNAITGSLPWASQAHTSSDVRGLWTGTCDATTFLRGDGSCNAPSGSGDMIKNAANTMGSSGTIDLSAATITGGFKLPSSAGAAPTVENQIAWDSTAHRISFGANGANKKTAYSDELPSTDSGASNNFLTAYDAPTHAFSKARPTWANIDKTTSSIADIATRTCSTLSDSAGGCSMSTTAAGDLSGTLPSATVASIQSKTVPTPAAGYLYYSGSGTTLAWQTPAGAGTVTHTSGALTSGYVALGNGSDDIKASTALDEGITAANQLSYSGSAGIKTTASGVGSLKLFESGTPTNFTGFLAPSAVTADYQFELPDSGFSAGFIKAAAISSNKSVLTVGTIAVGDLPAMSSADLYGKLSDETGSGSGSPLAVFNQSPVIVTPNLTTGFKVGSAAASGQIVRGDGTNFVPADDIRNVCYIAGGDNASSVLADADDQLGYWINDLGRTYRVVRVWAQHDTGTAPIINIQRDDGSANSILTSNLTTATGNGACADSSGSTMAVRGTTITCSNTISSTERDIAEGYALNFTMVTAGGAAKRVTVCAKLVAQ